MERPPLMLFKQSTTPSKKTKTYPYEEYYIGETDEESRRSGSGENHWLGAESIEWYNGHFTRDTMNGPGEYRWRYRGADGAFITYEGRFYANRMHGYGTMSYPDGRTFTGLFHDNIRWGPGIDSHVHVKADVGFWRGNQLVRLAWRPPAASLVPDFTTSHYGREIVELFRVILTETSKTVGETNSAIELLKQTGADPQLAAQMWTKLYSKHCTDLESQACHVGEFERECYGRKIHALREVTNLAELKGTSKDGKKDIATENKTYFAWNNNSTMLHIMKHCYQHEKQRRDTNKINLDKILNGPRKHFRPPGKHEQDCRTLLMASFLGHIPIVVQLVNEHKVHPDVADVQGNSAIMYATCGDHPDIIHFLVEAGANVNSYNDCCCTPLGVALMRYICVQNDIPPNAMVKALLPKPEKSPDKNKIIVDWHIIRDPRHQDAKSRKSTAAVKMSKSLASTTLMTKASTRSLSRSKSKLKQPTEPEYSSDDSIGRDKLHYLNVKHEYCEKVNKVFAKTSAKIPYLFLVENILVGMRPKEENGNGGANSSTNDPTFNSKESITGLVPSVELLELTDVEGLTQEPNSEKLKAETLSKIMRTILQLLADGADPKLVRCPQPALFIAAASMSTDLVQYMLRDGVDANEAFPSAQGYTALDIVLAKPFSYSNLGVIRTLLQHGADTTHRLQCADEPGPTLLHVMVNRKTDFVFEDEILRVIIDLLLEHNCDPLAQFKGRSVIEIVMDHKMDLLDIFIKNPRTDLNRIINDSNQTLLMKMFSPLYIFNIKMDRYTIFNNLLLHGADPLIECQEGTEKYRNIFVYAHKVFDEIEKKVMRRLNSKSRIKSMLVVPSKKNIKPGRAAPGAPRLVAQRKSFVEEDMFEYKRAIDLLTGCARFLFIRWLQAKLMKELVPVIFKYKHRVWCMILKEIKNGRSIGQWLTPQRCLEIWDILATTKKKTYKDFRILKQLLYIVAFYNIKSKETYTSAISPTMTGAEKNLIEADVDCLYREHRREPKLSVITTVRQGLQPELAVNDDHKYRICFECAAPLDDDFSVPCTLCNVISFCTLVCIENNIERVNCHPCSEYLRKMYFTDTATS